MDESMPLTFGADYYPEHWAKERWPRDVELMGELGFNAVRLAEFAWSRIEPREGHYSFDWLDEAIGMLSREGIKAIIGTPTAAPPPWIVKAHPDVLQVDGYGRRKAEGIRKNYCANNPNYTEYSKRIVEKMVLHYKDHPNVIGWQIDNEFGVDSCYCEDCTRAFVVWLRRKYQSVEELNSACGLVFWGQEYGSWDEIYPPGPPFGMHNPSLCLEWRRFSSDSWVKYQQIQVDIIRKYAPHQLITHNFMGLYKELDYFKLAETLDLISFDYYPRWSTKVDYAASAMAHDVMRSLKKKPYWIMELQSGAVKTQMAPIPRPGEIRLWTIQSVARGADGILYFRWRTCRFGAEEYWHGILDHDGIPRRRYLEVKKVSGELSKAAPYIEDTFVRPEVAFTLVYDNLWALELEVGYGDRSYYGVNSWEPALAFYRALYSRNIPVDFVDPVAEELGNYKAVFVPSLMLLSKKIEENLRSYVKQGGTIIATPRTGAKDWNNNLIEEALPGALSDVFGTNIEEYTGLPDGETVKIRTVETEMCRRDFYRGGNWAEMLSPTEAEVFARYQTGIYEDEPAVTVNDFGDGSAMYIGTFVDRGFFSSLVDWLARSRKVESVLPSAEGLEATKRSDSKHEIVFALNYKDNAMQIRCDGREFQDLVSGERLKDYIQIEGLDARILKVM
ncbi:MAG: beta-galactosidase [Candidatus Bathyarchaeota archaeon]|nr:beta-galactosidase [Candidatus Bathyarchaeota archaeon]